MRVFAQFSPDGEPLAFYSDDVWAIEDMPGGLTEITAEDRLEFIENPGRRRWVGDAVAAYTPPPPAPPPAKTYKADIWRRATDPEAATLEAMLAAATPRMRGLYRDATVLDHADPLFTSLMADFTTAFGAPRAAELLAPSA